MQNSYLESFVGTDDNMKPFWGQKMKKCRKKREFQKFSRSQRVFEFSGSLSRKCLPHLSIAYYNRDAGNDYRLINGDYENGNKNRFRRYIQYIDHWAKT